MLKLSFIIPNQHVHCCSTGPLIYGAPILYGNVDVQFRKYDFNQDGRIDFDEFVAMVEDDLDNFPVQKVVT
jgi:hypothetical protein